MKKVLIAGASGFIGKALIDQLLLNEEIEIVGLSRKDRESKHPRLTFKKCDLFSLKDILEAMEGCDYAYYLVHSMLPSAGLSQGSFYDFDLLMADNFARAAKKFELKQMIYLGGMIPEGRDLSWHLKSRLEVEEALRESGRSVTTLRAGLIVGPNGSSFTILQKLVERLPLMVCPVWTLTPSQPVALKDVIRVLVRSFNEPKTMGKIFDIGGPEQVTYQELILRTASVLGKKRKIVSFNLIPLGLSRLWVSLITSTTKDLVYPLVLSLKYPMVASAKYQWIHKEDLQTSLNDSLTEALQKSKGSVSVHAAPPQHDVRSIQRMPLPNGKNAEWVAKDYFRWLPSLLAYALKVRITGNECLFYLFHPRFKMLILELSPERSAPDRQLLYIRGGFLAAKTVRGRLEFREVLNHQYVMAAIHDFIPALPWVFYTFTQARVHLWVMRRFANHLKRIKN